MSVGRIICRLIVVIALTGVLAACANRQMHLLIVADAVAPTTAQISGKHSIFVATTRAAALDKDEVFSGARSPDLGLVKIDMTVPASHKVGALERYNRGKRDPSKYFTATAVTAYKEQEFEKALRVDIAKRNGRALVFIHGFNTRFDLAVYRMTQIVHDAGYDGTPVLFSWASAGRVTDYVYDNNSATAARDRLEATLRLLVRAGATRVDIIAHSMGNWVTMEALRQLAITNDRDLDGKLGDVVLASPDIDVDVFKSQMARYGVPDKPFIIMTSADDRALRLSSIIAGNRPRVGDYADAAELAQLGVTVINVSAITSGDRLNHSKFADNPVLVQLLGDRLRNGADLSTSEEQIADRVGQITGTLGGVVTKAADIIVTTPLRVITIGVGGS